VAKVTTTSLFVAGGLLILWSSYIHYHLWLTVGYRNIPTIGDLFVVQSVAGLVIGLLVIGVRRVWAGVLGAGFALTTSVGFLVSVYHGLFGFKDFWSAPFAHVAFDVEMMTIAVLVIAIIFSVVASLSGPTR
jgi:hypothetical protein